MVGKDASRIELLADLAKAVIAARVELADLGRVEVEVLAPVRTAVEASHERFEPTEDFERPLVVADRNADVARVALERGAQERVVLADEPDLDRHEQLRLE